MNNILLAPTTFAEHSKVPLEVLNRNNYEYIVNPKGRKLENNEIIKYAKNVSGIIAGTESYNEDVLNSLPDLKVISRLGVGLDNIDLKNANNLGIKIYTTNTSPASAVVELVLGLLINVARNISISDQLLRKNIWDKRMGVSLRGKTLGIIGLGNIGKELVKVSKGFGFKVLAFDVQKDDSFASDHNVLYSDLNTLLSSSDFISIHLNLTPETKNYINSERIKLMKSQCILINTSRGEIIDERALYNSLKSNKIAGAGLDVFHKEPYNGPLSTLDNVIITPHISAYAKEVRIQMEKESVENLIRGLNDE